MQRFAAWMGGMDVLLDEFLARLPDEIAGRLDYSIESLDVLEAWLLDRYPASKAVVDDPDVTRLGRRVPLRRAGLRPAPQRLNGSRTTTRAGPECPGRRRAVARRDAAGERPRRIAAPANRAPHAGREQSRDHRVRRLREVLQGTRHPLIAVRIRSVDDRAPRRPGECCRPRRSCRRPGRHAHPALPASITYTALTGENVIRRCRGAHRVRGDRPVDRVRAGFGRVLHADASAGGVSGPDAIHREPVRRQAGRSRRRRSPASRSLKRTGAPATTGSPARSTATRSAATRATTGSSAGTGRTRSTRARAAASSTTGRATTRSPAAPGTTGGRSERARTRSPPATAPTRSATRRGPRR